ncbi:MAG: aldo/keto reductase [Acidobacteria bacterium]|nr:aldo/keto reductase [Acidobacteriota bacterium]
MQTRALGNSDLQLTPLGIGAWAIGGGGWKFGWGPQDDDDSIAAIHAGLDAGLNWIDTAAIYGLGHSEEVVGRAVKSHGSTPYIFTKCERTWDEQGNIIPCLKADSIKRECEASLRRLGVDVIDLYQIHWPQPDEDVEEGWGAVAELQKEGKVRWIGVSNFSVDQLKRAHAIAPLTSLQPPYSILSPEIEDGQLPYVAENNIGVLAYSPMKSGLLTGKMTAERIAQMPADDFRKNTPHFQEPKLSRNMALVELLRAMGARHGRSPGEVAIAWALRRPEVTAAIVGLRSKAQVDGVIGAAEFRLTADEVAEIAAFMAANPA